MSERESTPLVKGENAPLVKVESASLVEGETGPCLSDGRRSYIWIVLQTAPPPHAKADSCQHARSGIGNKVAQRHWSCKHSHVLDLQANIHIVCDSFHVGVLHGVVYLHVSRPQSAHDCQIKKWIVAMSELKVK